MLPRVVWEKVSSRLSSHHACKDLPVPSPVISSQLAGPDTPDTANEMLRDLAGLWLLSSRGHNPTLKEAEGEEAM